MESRNGTGIGMRLAFAAGVVIGISGIALLFGAAIVALARHLGVLR